MRYLISGLSDEQEGRNVYKKHERAAKTHVFHVFGLAVMVAIIVIFQELFKAAPYNRNTYLNLSLNPIIFRGIYLPFLLPF